MVDEESVVRHVALEVRVRPVGAPQDPVGELLDHTAAEGHHVGVRVPLAVERGGAGDGEPLGAGHLHPDVVAGHEPQEAGELRPVHRPGHVRAPHVVDHQRGGQRAEEVRELGQVGALEVQHDVPAQRGDLLGDGGEVLLGRGVHQPPQEVEPYAAHARLVQVAQLLLGDVGADGGDAAGPAAGRAYGVEHGGVVRAVTGGLHQDVARDAQVVAEGEQIRLAAVAGGVLPLGREGELGLGSEDMAVRVDRAGRQGEPGPGGAVVPVEPAGGLGGEGAHGISE